MFKNGNKNGLIFNGNKPQESNYEQMLIYNKSKHFSRQTAINIVTRLRNLIKDKPYENNKSIILLIMK